MNDKKWASWEVQTSRQWSDVKDVLQYTNIDFIDHDHRILIEYALELNHLIQRSESHFSLDLIQETSGVLNKFYDYAVEHFAREEAFMDFYDLPDDDGHKREHNRILKMLRGALDDFASGKIKISTKLKTQVMDWLINHVNVIDYKFFNIKNWSNNLVNATGWDDVKAIIHKTGVSDIDLQHKRLTELAINLINGTVDDIADDILKGMFDEFIDYSKYHFTFEADFMMKYGIKEQDKHEDFHGFFIEKLEDFKAVNNRSEEQQMEMKSWVLTWWINHINLIDKHYFEFSNWGARVIEQGESLEEVEAVMRRTGIEVIDNDHLNLIEVVFKLNRYIQAYGPQNQVSNKNGIKRLNDKIRLRLEVDSQLDKSLPFEGQVKLYLEEVYGIAKSHFEREELIMYDKKIPDINSHKDEHKNILMKLENILKNYENGRLHVSANLKTMILDWWIDHTNTTDYRTFVQENIEQIKAVSLEKNDRKGEGQ